MAAMLVSGLVANAQFIITPQVGVTMATITDDSDAKSKFGLVAGANIEYPLSDVLSVSGGLLYSMQGCKYEYNGKSFNNDGDYLNIPLLAQYRVTDAIKVKAGIQPGILMSAKQDGKDYKDECNTLDWSIPLGISYDISDFVIDLRYNLGLSKINKEGEKSRKNSVFMLTIGYNIPF